MGLLLGTGPASVLTVSAQPGPVQDAINLTDGAEDTSVYDLVHINANPQESFLTVQERGAAQFRITISDHSVDGTEAMVGTVNIRCSAEISPDTPIEMGWAVSTTVVPPLRRHATVETNVNVVAGPSAAPEYLEIQVVCEAFRPFVREIGNFTLLAKVQEYTRLDLVNVGVLDPLGPDQEFTHRMELKNNGNQITTFVGRVSAPDGWIVRIPDSVTLQPGESRIIEVTGVTPRDKMVYITESTIITVTYGKMGGGPERDQPFVMQVNGVYVPPAVLPIVLLALLILGSLIFLGVLTRRAIEEQILGKPVPPWRISVERAYLNELMKSDPDEYYVVRYYLMVEEHRSALLWFAAYKKATKKDRKRERGWYKVKNKQERKIRSVEKDHDKVERSWDRTLLRVEKKRDRKVRKLEKKLRRKDRKKQRKVDRKHSKKVKKIDRKHRKKVKKLEKKHTKRVAKQTKKIERKNRKLEKKGQPLLPLPDDAFEPPEAPEHPEHQVFEEVPLEESRYAPRLDRIHGRFERKMERLRIRRDKAVSRSNLKAETKVERLQARIPPEPKTDLYDESGYVPEDEVVVEDDRPLLAKLLHIPTLEEREQMRRRRAVYRARLKEAKAAADPARVEEVQKAFKDERDELRAERREESLSARASAIEEQRLRKIRKRGTKERARAKRSSKGALQRPAVPDDVVAVEPAEPLRRIPVRSEGRHPAERSEEMAEEKRGVMGGFKTRFRRKGQAASEDDKKESSESINEASTGSKE